MKKVLIILLTLGVFVYPCYSQTRSKVDERFELTSIMFALAGAPEYCQMLIPSYKADIIENFISYEQTESINYIRELNRNHHIGYNAVSTTAEMLEIINGKIGLQSKYDISNISSYDPRWTPELFTKYIKMLNVFYKQSNFYEFFKKHQPLYDIAQQRMDDLLADISFEWFESFYGNKLNYDVTIYLSLVNGASNYAMPRGILIGLQGDMQGLPFVNVFNTQFVIIHEMAHHYTNPLFQTWWPQLEEAANKIYPHVNEQMFRSAYGNAETVFCEWLNNLFVLSYMKETHNKMLSALISGHIEKGFIWMRRSTDFMDNFYAQRNFYPHIENFMPQIVAFANYTADNFDFILCEYAARNPYITNVYPAIDSDITNFDEIIITFSEPMLGAWGFRGSGTEDEKIKCLPIEDVIWSDDMRQARLILNESECEPDFLYSIKLEPTFFQSSYCFPLHESNTRLTFNTR